MPDKVHTVKFVFIYHILLFYYLQQSRLAILKSLSKKLNLSNDIKLEKIVEKTEGFSGADLQAVLYTAQLNSVEHLLQDSSTKDHVSLFVIPHFC